MNGKVYVPEDYYDQDSFDEYLTAADTNERRAQMYMKDLNEINCISDLLDRSDKATREEEEFALF